MARNALRPSDVAPLSSRGVLVVTDDAATRDVFINALRGASEQPSFSEDLQEALERAQHESPDVVFVDVGLGNGAGVALIHHLRASTRDTRIVAMVRSTAVELGAQALSLGAMALVLSPPAGDEILSAVSEARERRAATLLRERLHTDSRAARLESELARELSRLGAERSRRAAAEALCKSLVERLGARAVAVYVPAAEKSRELIRIAHRGAEDAPTVADELTVLAHAAERGIETMKLELGSEVVGMVLHAGLEWHARHKSDLVELITAQASTGLALIGAREQAQRGAIKDPGSSAYTFAYFVDVAGREIDKARRHGRRFSLLTLALDDPKSPESHSMELAERALSTVRATDVLARVEDHEFYLLLPETGGIGAHRCRRRMLRKLQPDRQGSRGGIALPVSLGTATYPHDGGDLSALLRQAKRRADAASASVVQRRRRDCARPDDLLDSLFWDVAEASSGEGLDDLRLIELPLVDLVGLTSTVVNEALRGGAATLVVSSGAGPGLGAMARAAVGDRPNVQVLTIPQERLGPDIEALAVVAEHGCYAFLGRRERSLIRAIHASNVALLDLVLDFRDDAGGL